MLGLRLMEEMMDKAQLKKALKPIVRELMIEVLGERVLDEVVHRVVVESSDDGEGFVNEVVEESTNPVAEERRRRLAAAAKTRAPHINETRASGGPKTDEPFGKDFLDEIAAEKPDAYQMLRTGNSTLPR